MGRKKELNMCLHCGKEFLAGKYTRYCSQKCSYEAKLKTAELTPFEEAELKMFINDEQEKPVSCIGCPYISSQRCGELKREQMSASSLRYMKYRDKRCRQKYEQRGCVC